MEIKAGGKEASFKLNTPSRGTQTWSFHFFEVFGLIGGNPNVIASAENYHSLLV